jgi:hypothetical protein
LFILLQEWQCSSLCQSFDRAANATSLVHLFIADKLLLPDLSLDLKFYPLNCISFTFGDSSKPELQAMEFERKIAYGRQRL